MYLETIMVFMKVIFLFSLINRVSGSVRLSLSLPVGQSTTTSLILLSFEINKIRK